MTIHYHCGDIFPRSKLAELAGSHFLISHAYPTNVEICHRIGQSVMLDNGAFSAWKLDKPTNWPAYYQWCDRWLAYPTTWAVIPDLIEGTTQQQHALVDEWPFGTKGAPVWHLHEPINRALSLVDFWPKVCFGSSAQYAEVLSSDWCRRMDEVWNEIAKRHRHTPWVHMLRGMQCCRREWPFASVDSADIARNHNRPQNGPEVMASRWDREQCPPIWLMREQLALEEGIL